MIIFYIVYLQLFTCVTCVLWDYKVYIYMLQMYEWKMDKYSPQLAF